MGNHHFERPNIHLNQIQNQILSTRRGLCPASLGLILLVDGTVRMSNESLQFESSEQRIPFLTNSLRMAEQNCVTVGLFQGILAESEHWKAVHQICFNQFPVHGFNTVHTNKKAYKARALLRSD